MRTLLALASLALCLAACAPAAADAPHRAVVHMKDGSVLNGTLLEENAKECRMRTSFGELVLSRDAIEAVYVEKTPSGGGPPAAPPEPATGAAARPGKRNASPRIRDAQEEPPATPAPATDPAHPAGADEGALPQVDPATLLSLEDDELINLLQKSGKDLPAETVTPGGGGPPKAPVKKMYSYEGDKGNLLPPELTELELPKDAGGGGKPAAGKAGGAVSERERSAESLESVGKTLQGIVGKDGKEAAAATAEVAVAAPEAPPAAAGTVEVAAGTAEVAAGTTEVRPYDPPKDTIDGKIHKQFKRHGALSAHPEDFRALKGNEIDELLKKHVPASGGTGEINVKKTDEVKTDGK